MSTMTGDGGGVECGGRSRGATGSGGHGVGASRLWSSEQGNGDDLCADVEVVADDVASPDDADVDDDDDRDNGADVGADAVVYADDR